jgi:protein-tyrosine phosphatase
MSKRADAIVWVPVGAGRLALWHRPGRKAIPALAATGCQVVVTLLSEREGAPAIGRDVERAGVRWIWLPLETGTPAQLGLRLPVPACLEQVSGVLDEGRSVLVHCSAGIHRTGMFAYALLRARGLDRAAALDAIAATRAHTREGLVEEQIAWAEAMAAMPRPRR